MNKNITNTLGIIIVGFNSKKYLEECFRSIYKSSFCDFRVYFIDNDSSDGSISYLENNWKKVEIIKLKKNIGFAGANNIGVKQSIKDGCKYVFLLNPDTYIDSKCLEALYKNKDNRTILQPLILMHQNGRRTNLINTSGNILHYLGISYVGNFNKDYKKTKLIKNIALASGAAMFIPTGIIIKIGLFDEKFFMYHEDVDFCWRARMAGYNIELVESALVWHKYHFSRNESKLFYIERNRLAFIIKNFEFKTILLIFPMLLINEMVVIIHSVCAKYFIFKLRSTLSFLKLSWYLVGARGKNIHFYRDKTLKKYLSADLNFTLLDSKILRIYSVVTRLYWRLVSVFL